MFVEPGRLLAHALAQEGKPYRWNGKGPQHFDCSGLITYAIKLAGGPDLRATHNAHRLWTELEPLEALLPGDIALACYGYRRTVDNAIRCTHIMLAVGDGRVFGACGGGKQTLTDADAARDNAFVRFRRRVHYRDPDDFIGFRKLSFLAAYGGAPTGGAPNGRDD